MRYHALANEPVAMADEILTIAEVAQLLKVAEKTVYSMAQNSDLPCFKVRGQWRFRRLDLDTWMASQVAAGANPKEPAQRDNSPARKKGHR